MTPLNLQLATTHDHWLKLPASEYAVVEARLHWRHLIKAHPIITNALEWLLCGALTVVFALSNLIAQP
jgi:hypothetical protein